MNKLLLFIFSFILVSNSIIAQEDDLFQSEISQINELIIDINEYYQDEDKIKANDQLVDVLNDLLKKRSSYDYDFSDINGISIVSSKDDKLRLFTWDVRFRNLQHKCYGFIQYKASKRYYLCFQLKDFYAPYDKAKRKFPSHAEWYGAVYYDIVQCKINKSKTVYTLLGWRGRDALTQQKIIETLEFNGNNLPVFGKKRFKVGKKRENRLVFTYSSKLQMKLKYSPKHRYIIADHLSPQNPKFINQYQYYGADLSYDAYEFRNSLWYKIDNIDPVIAVDYHLISKRDTSQRVSESF